MMFEDKETGKKYRLEDDTHRELDKKASKGRTNTALGLGIGALGYSLLSNGKGLNLFNNDTATTPSTEDMYLERKECEDVLNLTKAIYDLTLIGERTRFADREVLNKEIFNVYNSTRNGFDAVTAKQNEDVFNLYKLGRDNKDEVLSEISSIKTELAVLKATRPYQDALIQCDIQRVAEHANYDLWRRTCRMIEGEVVLPNSPVVEGYASYNPCNSITSTQSTSKK